MSLVKFHSNRWPWNYGLTDFFEQTDPFEDDFFHLEKSKPGMNVREDEGHFEIELASPGFDKKDFSITLDDDILEVAAEKKANKEEKEAAYTRKEFNYRSFRRAVQLPKSIDGNQEVEASYANGILRLRLAKKMEAQKRAKKKIEVS
jgi:HSP20 family protein